MVAVIFDHPPFLILSYTQAYVTPKQMVALLQYIVLPFKVDSAIKINKMIKQKIRNSITI